MIYLRGLKMIESEPCGLYVPTEGARLSLHALQSLETLVPPPPKPQGFSISGEKSNSTLPIAPPKIVLDSAQNTKSVEGAPHITFHSQGSPGKLSRKQKLTPNIARSKVKKEISQGSPSSKMEPLWVNPFLFLIFRGILRH